MAEGGTERLDDAEIAPEARRAFAAMTRYLKASGLDQRLRDLVDVRASMVNGCAHCLEMHTHEALEHGEKVERLFQLDAWEESPVFTEREKAALAWAEAVTRVADGHVPDAVYERARKQFTDKELVDLTWATAVINVWNRLAIAFRLPPESR